MAQGRSRTPGGSRHKLLVPQPHFSAVPRTGLLGLLLADDAPRTALLQAPAGHGKTSLLVQVEAGCRAAGMRTGWLTLDDTDDDANRLFDHLLQVALLLGEEGQADADERPSASGKRDASSRLAQAFARIPTPAAVFIDDIHFVLNPAALRLMSGLLTVPLPGIRWFLASRTRPALNIARMLVNGEAAVHDAEALRFSSDEALEFFAMTGESPAPEELVRLMRATEGWPAALQLYKLARLTGLGPGEFSLPESRELTDYLAENVLLLQEDSVREFLLSTCVLERLSPAVCAVVSGQGDAAAMLALLEERGLFVRRLSRSEGWYTYHTVFSGFLRDFTERHRPGRLAELHLLAGRWYAEHLHHEEAIRHLAESGAVDLAADVFERWLDELIPSGYMVTADRWLDVIPAEELAQRDSLMVKVSWALAFLTRNRKLDHVLELWRRRPSSRPAAGEADPALMLCIVDILADRLLESAGHIEHIDVHDHDDVGRFRLFELGVVCNARAYRMMALGQLDDAAKTFAHGAELNRRADSSFALAYSTAMAGFIALQQGRPAEALSMWDVASRETAQPVEDSLTAASVVCGQITGRYEVGDLDLALQAFDSHRELIEVGAIHDHFVLAHRAAGRTHQLRGDVDRAVAILEQGWGIAMEREWPRVARLLRLEQVRIAVLSGELDRARMLYGSGGPEGDPRIVRASAESEDEAISLARLSIATGDPAGGLELIAPALKHAARQGRVLRQIKLQLLACLAHAHFNNERRAHRALQQALVLAAPGGCVQGILDEGEPVLSLVQRHGELLREVGLHAQPPEVQKLLTALLAPGGSDAPANGAPPEAGLPRSAEWQLTEREETILRMLAQSMSNAEIAKATFVSPDGVKYHLKNIYSKLGARNRVEAALIARERGYS